MTRKKQSFSSWLKEHYGIILLVIAFILLELIVINQTLVLRWDEPVYLANARSHLSTSHFTEDFRFPLLEFFIAGLWLITGESLLAVQVMMVVMGALTVVITYVLASLFLSKKYSLGAAALLASSKLFIIWSVAVYTDIPSLLFMLLAAYFAAKYFKEQKYYILAISGLCTSIAFLMRFPAAIIALIIIYLLLSKKDFKGFIWYAAGNAVIILPWMLINFLVYQNPVWDLIAQKQAIDEYTSWQPTIYLFAYLLNAAQVFIAGLVAGIIFLIREKKKSIVLIILFWLFTLQLFYYAYIVNLKLERYVLMLLPMVYIFSMYALQKTFHKIKTITWFKQRSWSVFTLGFLIFILLFSLVISWDLTKIQAHNEAICRHNSAVADSITFAQEHIPSGELIFSNAWTWYGYFGNHRARYLWSPHASELLEGEQQIYIITNNKGDLPGTLDFSGVQSELLANFTAECHTQVLIYHVWGED